MTERKPPGMTWETWIDRQIREAQERGDFDALAGAGRPLPDLDAPHDPDWWHKKLLRREGVAHLPPALQLRKDVEVALDAAAHAGTEEEVTAVITAINARILDLNRKAHSGPPSTLMPLDLEHILTTWREGRTGREPTTEPGGGADPRDGADPRRGAGGAGPESTERAARRRRWRRRRAG